MNVSRIFKVIARPLLVLLQFTRLPHRSSLVWVPACASAVAFSGVALSPLAWPESPQTTIAIVEGRWHINGAVVYPGAAELSVRNGASWGFMHKDENQFIPFEYGGAQDDPIVYAAIKRLIRAPMFPGETWEARKPAALGLDAARLAELAEFLGGRGCVIKDGYVVKVWGDQAERSDWMSSAKPVLSTMLFFAVEEGLVDSVDQPIAEFGWELRPKDRAITFRCLGAMSSGYMRPEAPGEAWAYNDYAIQIYQQTLFDKIFKDEPRAAAEHPDRLGALGFEDGLRFRDTNRRMSASVRDFARLAWFWLNRGRWGDKQVLPARYFDEYMQPQTAPDLPHTQSDSTEDYLGIGSYGGGTDHFTRFGAGIYGFNWWFNETGRLHPDARTWPHAPADTVMSIGAGGNCSVIIPSLNLVLVNARGNWGRLDAGNPDSRMNQALAFLAEALDSGSADDG